MRVLFLDLETIGLRPKDLVWQVAYAKAVQEDAKLKVLEVVELVGVECIQSKQVKEALEWANVLIAHNTDFEERFLRHRGLPVPKESFCTMRQATHVCQIPNPYWSEENEWLSPYKWPRLSEAVEILGLEDQLKNLVKDLAFHDALCDIYATMLLYAKLKNLSLELEGHRIRRASSLRKYLIARKYAVVGKEELLQGIASQNVFIQLLERFSSVYELYKQWRQRKQWKDELPF